MLLDFVNFGIWEIIIITFVIFVAFFIFEQIGKYGEDTALGFWGSVLLAVFVSPIAALLIIFIIKPRKRFD